MRLPLFGFVMFFTSLVNAHTALMACYDEGNGYLICEGGFSDGASAQGVQFRIEQNDHVLYRGQFDEFGEIYIEKPQGEFVLVLNAGEGHVVYIESSQISQ